QAGRLGSGGSMKVMRHQRALAAWFTALMLLSSAAAAIVLFSDRAGAAESAPGAAAPRVLRELPEKRQVYSTTYLLDNGQRKTVMSTVPVHYRDADGAFQPVDLTPQATA